MKIKQQLTTPNCWEVMTEDDKIISIHTTEEEALSAIKSTVRDASNVLPVTASARAKITAEINKIK